MNQKIIVWEIRYRSPAANGTYITDIPPNLAKDFPDLEEENFYCLNIQKYEMLKEDFDKLPEFEGF